MDSLSQIVLGGAVAAAVVPAAHRRAALLAGAGVKLGCDHTNYPQHIEIAPEQLASLVKDIRA